MNLLVLCVFLNLWLFFDSTTSEPFQLYILHTNDVHSRFEMFNKKDLSCKIDPTKPISELPQKKRCYGGVARRAGFINEFRRKYKNVLLLDAGDQFQGTPWFYIYKGVAASHFLNRLKYDAMALGVHEFDNGLDGLDPLLRTASFPILCNNLQMNKGATSQMKITIKPYVVVEISGRKIGIIGYLTAGASRLLKTDDLFFSNDDRSLMITSDILKRNGVDIIIAVGHAGLTKDKQTAERCHLIDVIVGGHSHSLLYTGKNPCGDQTDGEYPWVFKDHERRTSLVVQAGSYGKYVGMLNLTFDDAGKLTDWSGNPVLMDHTIPDDRQIKLEVEKMSEKVSLLNKEVVGKLSVPLDASDDVCRIAECNFGNLLADILVEQLRQNRWWKDQIVIALVNGGMFRNSIDEGRVTYEDVIKALPLHDRLVMVHMKGLTLVEVLEHSVSDFSLTEKSGKFMQFSDGLEVIYNMSRPNGNRVTKVSIGIFDKCPGLTPLRNYGYYYVIMPGFLVNGGDGFSMLESYKDDVINFDVIDSDALIGCLAKHSPVTAYVENRIRGLDTYPGWTEEMRKREKIHENIEKV